MSQRRRRERKKEEERDDSHPRYVNVNVIGTESRATTFELTATSGERRLRHAPWNVGPYRGGGGAGGKGRGNTSRNRDRREFVTCRRRDAPRRRAIIESHRVDLF